MAGNGLIIRGAALEVLDPVRHTGPRRRVRCPLQGPRGGVKALAEAVAATPS